ncbi:MAG: hypothetical protein LUO98_00615 [Methanoregula sp.]|nr:hypothetical protein [Methanoregula sp.]
MPAGNGRKPGCITGSSDNDALMMVSFAPSACVKSGRTGFFEMVVEKMAKNPSREK